MKVINLFGGPGCGKSTTAAGLFHLMKLEDYNVELVTEYAKDMTWEERHNILQDQLYITAKQNRRLLRLQDKVEWIVTDSPLILGLNYMTPDYLGGTYKKLLLELNNSYNNINIRLIRTKSYNPIGRNQTELEAKEIDKNILQILEKDLNSDFYTIPGDRDAPGHILHFIQQKYEY